MSDARLAQVTVTDFAGRDIGRALSLCPSHLLEVVTMALAEAAPSDFLQLRVMRPPLL